MKHDAYYQAMLARDYRFDGKFFVGVKTTGIYCRPICPARPKPENVEFFVHAGAAEKAGYRPCLRCRPESAPLSPAWYGKTAVVNRALKAIASHGYFEQDEDEFAAQFGVTARHLRRLFVDEIGQTPKQIAFNNRLGFARKLVVETNLPMTSVALTAGFSSLRRFNDAFKKRFHRVPTALRKKQDHQNGQSVQLTLSYRPPFDWQHLLSYYRSHQIVGVETITDTNYERVIRFGRSTGAISVGHDEKSAQIVIQVTIDDPAYLFPIAQRVRQMFDLDSDPILVANCFQLDKFLTQIWKKHSGLRVARGWDPFESAAGVILGQLVSLAQGRTLVKSLVETYGEKLTHPITGNDAYLFPTPDVLTQCDLSQVKTTEARKNSIRELAKRVLSGELDLHSPRDPSLAKEDLLSIPGIGPWSAEMICLRALGHTDAFPESDLIIKRAIEKHADIDLESLRPWRAYVAVYFWKQYAESLSKQKGVQK